MHQNNCLPFESFWLPCFLGEVVLHTSDIMKCLASDSPVWNHIIFPVSERDGLLCFRCYLDVSFREPLIGSPYLGAIEYIGYCFFLDLISSDIVRRRGEASIFAFWYLVHESFSSSDFFFLSGSGVSHVISVNDLGAVYHHVDFRQVLSHRGVDVMLVTPGVLNSGTSSPLTLRARLRKSTMTGYGARIFSQRIFESATLASALPIANVFRAAASV